MHGLVGLAREQPLQDVIVAPQSDDLLAVDDNETSRASAWTAYIAAGRVLHFDDTLRASVRKMDREVRGLYEYFCGTRRASLQRHDDVRPGTALRVQPEIVRFGDAKRECIVFFGISSDEDARPGCPDESAVRRTWRLRAGAGGLCRTAATAGVVRRPSEGSSRRRPYFEVPGRCGPSARF
jgi:hypothetical protein